MKALTLSMFLTCAAAAAQAGKYEDGMRLLESKSFVAAAAAFQRSAAEGSAEAERQSGFMYYKRLGFKQSDAVAVIWFERAAEHGDLQSQLNLGQMYENGLSFAQSDSRSAYWYRMAADQGDRSAQFRMGEIYYLGTGVARSGPEAVKWWALATRDQDQVTEQMRATIDAPLRKLPPDVHEQGQRLAREWTSSKELNASGQPGGARR